MPSVNKYKRAVNKAGYTKSYNRLLAYGYRVRAFLLLNVATFATLPISGATQLTDLQSLVAALSLYTGKTTNRTSKAQLAIIQAAANVVKSNLNILTAYVNNIALGDPAIIALSGMAVDKARKPIGRLAPVQNFRQFISPAVSRGDAKVSWKRPIGSKLIKGYSFNVDVATSSTGTGLKNFGKVTQTKAILPAAFLATVGAGPTYFVRVTPVSPVLHSAATSDTHAIGAPSPWLSISPQF